jgi:hypothetical protein
MAAPARGFGGFAEGMHAINPRNSFSVAASKRLFLPGGGVYSSSTLMEPVATQHLGEWWTQPAATCALAKLDAGLAGALAPVAGVVQDLLHFLDPHEVDAAVGARVVNGVRVGAKLRRRTAFVTGSGVAANDEWHELDTSQAPSALLLTHTFDDAPLAGSSLVLRTLFLGDALYETTPAGMLRDVFQRATPVLTPASLEVLGKVGHYGPTTDVLINGISLDAAALAVLPAAQRKAITAARRTQLLSVIHGCITQRWPGGFLALRHIAEELLSLQARAWTEPLAAYLLLTRTGGVPTDDLMSSHTFLADALAGDGKFAEAAAVLRACLADDASYDGGELIPFPASLWYELGISETHAGKYADAVAAYRSGLAALESARPIHPEISAARVSSRGRSRSLHRCCHAYAAGAAAQWRPQRRRARRCARCRCRCCSACWRACRWTRARARAWCAAPGTWRWRSAACGRAWTSRRRAVWRLV